MAESESRTELIARATKAIIADNGLVGVTTAQSADYLLNPNENLNRVLEVVQQDPVVRGAITTLIDKTLEPGYSFYGKDKKSRQQSAIDKMGELRFDALMRRLLQHLFTYNNAFIEIVKAGDEVTELHMLDPRYIEVQSNKHGEVKQYVQKAPNGEIITWTPKQVVHIKTTPLSGSVWGDVDLKALWTTCALSYHIKKLYLWQYETNQFRPLLNIQNATDDQIKRFLAYLEQARSDIKRLIPIEGEVEAIVLGQMHDFTKVKDLLTYLDYEKLNLLQVPPISVGLPDNSNRSNSDAQERALNTRIRSIQRNLEDTISYDFMPNLNFEKVTLKFNVIDDKALDSYLQMAERMKNMGFKEELIKDFLESKGFDLPEGDIFEAVDVNPETGMPLPKGSDPQAAASFTKKSMDMMPSRQGKMPGTANKKIGSGEQSTTRKDQLVARTDRWTYEVEVPE